MDSRIRIWADGRIAHEMAGTRSWTLGGSADDTVHIAALPACAVSFAWNARALGWQATVSSSLELCEMTHGSVSISPGQSLLWQSRERVQFGMVDLEFSLEVAPPLLRGEPVESIPLANKDTLIELGRGSPDLEGKGLRITLDEADPRISKIHARLTRENGGWLLADESRIGTELNGAPFKKEKLIYGDRFRIGEYVFEFRCDELVCLRTGVVGGIVARDIHFRVKDFKILHGISLDISPGEFVGILGLSGQGKSTLLNALCGINPPTSGKVWLSGISMDDRERMREAGVGYVPQDDIVHRELIVRDAIRFSAQLRLNLPSDQIEGLIDRTISKLGLTEHAGKRVSDLSGGQRKRVSIGIELLGRPAVLFLDEPSSGLDPATEESLMALLQSLTLTGLTVVCTTHVLQKAYLFDRLLFVHGGRSIFFGTSDEARTHFLLGGSAGESADALGRAPLERIYSLIGSGDRSAEEWESAFTASAVEKAAGTSASPGATPVERQVKQVPAWKAVLTLIRRQFCIMAADPLNLLFLFAQAVGIAVLIAWVADDIGLRMFLVLIAAMWFGCSNAAQQVVGELPIVRRERVCGLGLLTYLNSKVLYLGTITLLQAAVLVGTTHTLGFLVHSVEFDRKTFDRRLAERLPQPPPAAILDDVFVAMEEDGVPETAVPDAPETVESKFRPMPDWQKSSLAAVGRFFYLDANILESGPRTLIDARGHPILSDEGVRIEFEDLGVFRVPAVCLVLRLIAVGGAAVVGMFLGLAVSSLVRTTTQAVMWVPLLLIPQILFGGFVITLPEMNASARTVAVMAPSFAAGELLDVSFLYGAATPFLTNRSKTPMFLTSNAEKEEVEWEIEGQTQRQSYDRISHFNTAWQNRLISPERLGQHKQAADRVAGTTRQVYRDTVETRDDVRLTKGNVYRSFAPAWHGAAMLALWAGICFTAAYCGLRAKQHGH